MFHLYNLEHRTAVSVRLLDVRQNVSKLAREILFDFQGLDVLNTFHKNDVVLQLLNQSVHGYVRKNVMLHVFQHYYCQCQLTSKPFYLLIVPS